MTKLGLIADAHGNLPAFEAGLRHLQREGVDQVVFLGDAVGYLPDPGVVRALRRLGLPALLGNHDAMLADPPADRDVVYQLARCRAQLSEEEIAWLTTLPERMTLHPDGVEVRLCHGAPDDPVFGYVYPDTSLDDFDMPARVIFVAGNTHRPMARRASSGALFCNPGSCGLPRDCGGLGAVGVLDAAAREFRVLRYDISATAGLWAARCAPIHQSVLALFARRGDNDVVGEKPCD